MENEYLEFDHLPFKLAVIEVLMYDNKLLGELYNGAAFEIIDIGERRNNNFRKV